MPDETGGEVSAAELARVRAQVRATIKERLALEKTISNPAAISGATEQAYRDRDALISPSVVAERRASDAAIAELRSRLADIEQIDWRLARFGGHIRRAPELVRTRHQYLVDTVMPELRRQRDLVAQMLSDAGLGSLVNTQDGG